MLLGKMYSARNNWNLALCLSVVVHFAVLAAIPKAVMRDSVIKKEKHPKEIEVITETIKKIKHSVKYKDYSPSVLKNMPPPYLNKAVSKLFDLKHKDVNIDKPMMLDNDLKNVIFAKLPREEELKKNPAYMDYYQSIRDKIRARAYRYYKSDKEGEVFLTFIISNNGRLEGLYLNNTSSGDKDLVEISLRSIKDSSPFPPFPPQLKYSKLQFSISIRFKNN